MKHILEEIPLGETAEDTGGLCMCRMARDGSQAAFVASVVRGEDWVHLIDV